VDLHLCLSGNKIEGHNLGVWLSAVGLAIDGDSTSDNLGSISTHQASLVFHSGVDELDDLELLWGGQCHLWGENSAVKSRRFSNGNLFVLLRVQCLCCLWQANISWWWRWCRRSGSQRWSAPMSECSRGPTFCWTLEVERRRLSVL
jgi:hypothetical protein